MFDEVIREIRRLEGGVEISIEIAIDEDGFFDRVCPSSQCNVDFKVLFDDWRDKVQNEVVYCPICRFEAESDKWNTSEQQDYIEQAANNYLHQQLDKAFSQNTRRFNRSQPSGSFINMSMSYTPSSLPILIPADASEIMRQQSTCEQCNCRYSSIGAAFFCPACGHNSAASTFDSGVETVRKTIDLSSTIREAL